MIDLKQLNVCAAEITILISAIAFFYLNLFPQIDPGWSQNILIIFLLMM